MSVAWGLLAVTALILANGYFVAMEFSYVAVRRSRIEELAEAGDRRATRALAVLRRLSFMLSGAQLGITVTSLVVGFIAEETIGAAIRPLVELAGVPQAAAFGISLTLGFGIATAAQMVLGELAPKNLAIALPEPFALALSATTRLYIRVAGPLIHLFDSASNRLLRALGIEPVEELEGGVSAEELELIIAESGRAGSLTPSQATLLSRVLEFRSLRAGDAMVARPQVVTAASDATCDDLRRLAIESGHSRFPVVGEGLDDVRGVVQAKAVLGVPASERATREVSTLTAPALAVPESALLGPLLADLRDAHSQLALVIDEYGGTAGIVTLEDIVEELVGEIQDEFDRPEPAARMLPDGSYDVPGSWRLDECERDTGVALPEGDYDTLSGLVMAHLGRVPDVGDEVELSTARLRVIDLSGLAVGRLLLTPIQPDDEPGVQQPGAQEPGAQE